MCGWRCFNHCNTFANIDVISSKSYRNLGECGLLPFLMEATINHESTGKLYAHCLLIRKLEWWIVVHVIVSLHISSFRCLASLLDATVLLTLLLLSLTGKSYKNIGECDLLPFAMVEVRIKHHQFRLLSHFILKRQWSKHSYRKWKLRYWRPLCAHSDRGCTVESMGDQK